ncbi:MAG: PRC-barrel domain-containing protein [Thiogranum sp.]|nr:PRC-barrel domain-containing protein [Thiogranum sp.]
MKNTLALMIVMILLPATSPSARADCAARIDELRAVQAEAPYLDPNRPDLEKLRQVAQNLGEQGREQLCIGLVEEMEALVQAHREHAKSVNDVQKYAVPVPITAYSEELQINRLVGMPVRNRLGEELGVVEDLSIRPDQERLEALLIKHGGFLGIGESIVRVPWEDALITRDGSAVVLDKTGQELERAAESE